MKIYFIVLVLCLTSISPVSSSRDFKQADGVLGREIRANPTRVLLQLAGASSGDSENDPTCGATRTTDARWLEGRLAVLRDIENQTACCVACQGVPNSECRSWWREERPNQPCYLNSNRPRSS